MLTHNLTENTRKNYPLYHVRGTLNTKSLNNLQYSKPNLHQGWIERLNKTIGIFSYLQRKYNTIITVKLIC